jgi:hypothetical protein
MAQQGFNWNILIWAAVAYVAYRLYVNWQQNQALAAAAGPPVPDLGAGTPSNPNLESVASQYLGQELAQQQALNQAVTQKILDQLTQQQQSGNQATTGSTSTGASAGQGIPAGAAQIVAQIEANSLAWWKPGTTKAQRAALEAANENLRSQLAQMGIGSLTYNPKLGYVQLQLPGGGVL